MSSVQGEVTNGDRGKRMKRMSTGLLAGFIRAVTKHLLSQCALLLRASFSSLCLLSPCLLCTNIRPRIPANSRHRWEEGSDSFFCFDMEPHCFWLLLFIGHLILVSLAASLDSPYGLFDVVPPRGPTVHRISRIFAEPPRFQKGDRTFVLVFFQLRYKDRSFCKYRHALGWIYRSMRLKEGCETRNWWIHWQIEFEQEILKQSISRYRRHTWRHLSSRWQNLFWHWRSRLIVQRALRGSLATAAGNRPSVGSSNLF